MVSKSEKREREAVAENRREHELRLAELDKRALSVEAGDRQIEDEVASLTQLIERLTDDPTMQFALSVQMTATALFELEEAEKQLDVMAAEVRALRAFRFLHRINPRYALNMLTAAVPTAPLARQALAAAISTNDSLRAQQRAGRRHSQNREDKALAFKWLDVMSQ